MKSCSQPACEQVSDAQNRQEGDKSIRFEIPSIKNQDEGRRKKQIKSKTGLPATLNSNPDSALDFIRATPALLPPNPQPLPPLENWGPKNAPLPLFAQ